MKREIISSVNSKIYRRFPEVKGKSPKVSVQNSPKSKSSGISSNYLFIYSGQVITSDNRSMQRYIRVVVSDTGKILKVSTSR